MCQKETLRIIKSKGGTCMQSDLKHTNKGTISEDVRKLVLKGCVVRKKHKLTWEIKTTGIEL